MSLSLFNTGTHPPSKPQIMEALGRSYIQWIEVIQYCRDHYPPLAENWKNYGKSSGWTLMLVHKDKTIIFLFPNKSFFNVFFIVDEITLQKIKNESFPDEIMQQVASARSYQNDKSFNIQVRNAEDTEWVKKLIRIKMMK